MKTQCKRLLLLLLSASALLASSSCSFQKVDEGKILKTIREAFPHYGDGRVEITGTTDVGQDWTLVEYKVYNCNDEFLYNEFMMYSPGNGDYEILPRDAALVKIVDENRLVFEIKGEYAEGGGFYQFPFIADCVRTADGEKHYGFMYIPKPEYYELTRPVWGGGKECDEMSRINITLNGFEVLFAPAAGKEGAFYAAASYIPPIRTSYDEGSNQLNIKMDKCEVGEGVVLDKDVLTDGHAYISSYRVVRDGGKLTVAVKLRETAAGYMIGCGKVPLGDEPDGYPYLYVEFTTKDNMASQRSAYR